MIDRRALLSDLQKLLGKLETDLLERSESADVPEVGTTLRAEYDRAKTAERTAQNYEDWRTDAITQAAAAWVLSCVFVRFLEDNRLIDPPKLSGQWSVVSGQSGQTDNRQLRTENSLERARDEHELYFRSHPQQTDREYLLAVFDQLAKLPGTKDVFGEHNPIRELPNWLSGDAAGELLKFFQKIEANSGLLVHDFTDSNWDTRFLGDLYQDLSEAARKKYALLQTPEFVEEFILERTLEPALEEFGLTPNQPLALATVSGSGGKQTEASANGSFKMIDPACGSGHFLLGSFRRILERWQRREPGTNVRELVQRTLDSVHGVDVNPFAIAIARFRLLLAAMRACGIERLKDAPAFRLNLVCGDSLLHAPLAAGGKKYTAGQQELDFALASDPEDSDECDHAYRSESLPELKRLLRGGQYHAVVANPPYITPKDRQLNERYRRRFLSCHMKYSLSVPFLERIFRLAVAGGYTGQITANSFMKREFGKKLIESFFPTVDLTHVIDTSGAYIPGHGTPTVILFGRHRPPVASTMRTVMGIRGEPSTPDDPARGLVWSAIIAQVDDPGSQSEFVSVSDSPRELFHKHPWSVGGGGAAELKQQLDDTAVSTLVTAADAVGVLGMTNANDLMMASESVMRRRGVERAVRRPIVFGDDIRDWSFVEGSCVLFPYASGGLLALADIPGFHNWVWPCRTVLGNRATFSKLTYFEEGRHWWEWHQIAHERLRTNTAILFALVATHNQFVFDRDGRLISQATLVVKLGPQASEADYLTLTGLLNSSVAGFWMRQVFHDKGGGGIGGGIATESWEHFREYDSSKLKQFPLPAGRPLITARLLDNLATRARDFQPASITSRGAPTRAVLATAQSAAQFARSQMIAYQEELDWECYRLYGLIAAPTERPGASRRSQADEEPAASAWRLTTMQPPPLKLGQRAFEIVLARKMAAGETQTTWFERHGSTPITELPAEWPDDYRQLVERRIDLIASDPNIRLIEQPEYKRRWNTEPWDTQLERALREWLLDRLESYFDFDGRMRDERSARVSDPAASADRRSPGDAGTVGDSGDLRSGTGAGSGDPRTAPRSPAPLADIALVSVAKLADVARQDAEFQQVGELYRNDPAFDVQALVTELVTTECVPLLPVLRYKPSGLIKRGVWERTWELQREEDRISNSKSQIADLKSEISDSKSEISNLKSEISNQKSPIPVPTKYDSKDFLDSNHWRLRGKLDVPKERWISFPHCEGPDGTPVIAWAGYDHLQQARAISAYYVRVQTEFGGTDDARLIPLLACLIEVLPWLKQWHNDPDAAFDGMRMGDYFEGFVNEEARQLNKTVPEIKAWTSPQRVGRRGRVARNA